MTTLTVNGNTYSDDRNPTTGLGGGGHRTRLIPLFGDSLVEIGALVGNVLGFGTRFVFDAGTAAADPGAGLLRFNNAASASATAIHIDNLNSAGGDISGWLTLIGVNRGQLHLRNASGSKWRVYNITSVTANGGWATIAVSFGSGSGAEFTAAESLIVSLAPAGPPGTVSAAGDGTISAPGFAFASEAGLGMRRKGAALAAITASGADLLELRIASLAEAQAGTNTLALMSPQRVLDAIRRNAPGNTGGQTATGDLTLTVTSAGAILVTPTAPGFFVTLPAANTFGAAGPGIFSIYNAGHFDYGIRDSTGTRLGWIPPRGSAVIDLVSNGTAAGTWNCVGAVKLGITAQFVNPSITGAAGGAPTQAIDMGSGRTLFLIANSDLYGLVYDGPTRAWGSMTLIRAGVQNGFIAGIQTVAGSQALVCSCNSGGTTFQAVVLTIATTAITVNTPVSATLAGNGGDAAPMVAVGSSYLIAYGRQSTTIGLRAITISGTTPTIGAESAVASSVASFRPADLYVSGSVVRVITASTATTVLAQPYTVSGTTLTAGTAATATATANDAANMRTYQNSNGNIVAVFVSTTPQAAIFRLTGTTEAASTVNLGGAHLAGLNNNSDLVDLTGGKTLVAWTNAGQTGVIANILTDTAGTASAGTALTIATPQPASQGVAALFGGASAARLLVHGAATSDPNQTQITLGVSGASPTLTAVQQLRGHLPDVLAVNANLRGRRSVALLRAGTAAYVIPQASAVGSGALLATPNNLAAISRPRTGVRVEATIGAADFQSWFGQSTSAGGNGLILNQMECAA
jgi:hypothetical protein